MHTSQSANSRTLWALACPLILTNITQPLLGMVDTALLGHLPHQAYLGGAALGTSLLAFLFWGFGFLRMGTTGFVARALGEGSVESANAIGMQHGILALGLALGVLLVGPWLLLPAIELMGASDEVTLIALDYSRIRIWAAPATLLTYVLIGWFIAAQRMRAPLYVMLATQITNIGLDVVFIVWLDWRANGAALASTMAEYTGLLLALWLMRDQLKSATFKGLKKFQTPWNALFSANQHLMLRTWGLLGVLVFFTAQGAQLGDTVLAANAILLQLVHLASYCLDGLAHATESLIGNASGRRDKRARAALLKLAMGWSLLVALLLSGIFWVAQAPLLALMSDISAVQAAAREAYGWALLLPLVSVAAYVWDGYCIGVGATRRMRDTLIGSALVVFIPCWWLGQGLGNHGLWLAFCAFNLARGLSLTVVNQVSQRYDDSKI
ncbi:MATE family efflux transporter [Simiduia sp. 21SJ11W-1]|uniref:MATE family efflux transporter n=1 Tax=Simiduia sp. 21SJ11W-1 TaxID=2909669 RepID=UPI00209F3CC9|nr:MATE family efflux transporter [Simiduia sp. 21SJ11W-1]UTA47912.1 MATE family efflux transporter [Simiduia sp. 21SJ11W-1]